MFHWYRIPLSLPPTHSLLGEEDAGGRSPAPVALPSSPVSPIDDQPSMSILFGGISYLGSSSVDAPISEREANRKMYILKKQAEESQPIPVVLSIPVMNEGSIVMRDPESEQPMTVFSVKTVLFCARGNADELLDCFCLNIRHRRSGMYHCHVFQCEIREAVSKADYFYSLYHCTCTLYGLLHTILASMSVIS